MSMHKDSSYIEDQFGESFINFRPLSSENEAFTVIIIVVVIDAQVGLAASVGIATVVAAVAKVVVVVVLV